MGNENAVTTMQTPAAVLAPKQQYLNLVMNSIFKIGELCAATEPTKEVQAKIGMYTQMTINYIPNPKERKRLTGLRDSKRAEALRIKNLDEQRDALFRIDCEIVGEIMELMDDILAIVERQAILKSSAGVSDLEKMYYPNNAPVVVQEQENEPESDD